MFVGFTERIILFHKVLQNLSYKQDKSLHGLKHEKEEQLFVESMNDTEKSYRTGVRADTIPGP